MLRRSSIRQIKGEPHRELWVDEVLELVIWTDQGAILGFELTVRNRHVFRLVDGKPFCGITNSGDAKHGQSLTNTISERWDKLIDFRAIFEPRSGDLPVAFRTFILESLPAPKPEGEQGGDSHTDTVVS